MATTNPHKRCYRALNESNFRMKLQKTKRKNICFMHKKHFKAENVGKNPQQIDCDQRFNVCIGLLKIYGVASKQCRTCPAVITTVSADTQPYFHTTTHILAHQYMQMAAHTRTHKRTDLLRLSVMAVKMVICICEIRH